MKIERVEKNFKSSSNSNGMQSKKIEGKTFINKTMKRGPMMEP